MSPTGYPFSQHRISSSQWPLLLHEGSQLYLTLFDPCGLQRTRPPCRSPITGVYSNSSPLSQWCHPTISVISFSSCLQSCPASGSFQMSQPKYWSFSFSIIPSNAYSRLISFRMDWFDLLAVQGTLKSLLQYHSSKASILWHSAFFMVQLLHWKKSYLWLSGTLSAKYVSAS